MAECARRAMKPLTPSADPPRGAPWDSALANTPLVFFDLEMTGLDPTRDSIVEVAFVRQCGGTVLEQFVSLVAPEVPPSPAAIAMHGLDAAALADAPRFDTIAPRIASLLAGAVPIAHGVALDVAFLSRALTQAGCDAAPLSFVLDTVTLARRALASPRYTLRELCRTLGLPARRWHRALEDVEALRAVFPCLVRELAPPDARDLWEVRVGQREAVRVRHSLAERITALAKSHAPASFVFRPRRRPPSVLRGVVERWTPPHVYIRPAGTRSGLQIVRADRLLRIEP
jgi:DNA polymerase III epsilon subunit-like protein